MKDLLLEIGTEEMPAKFLPGAVSQLARLAEAELTAAAISFAGLKTYATPRRLALLVSGLPLLQAQTCAESKGPSLKIAYDPDGSWSKAAAGFARAQGVAADTLEARDGYLYAVKKQGGRPVAELLPQMLFNIITSLNFPKSMRWSDMDFRFVRPIHWLVALWGAEVVPLEIAGIKSGAATFGHRFLAAGRLTLTEPAQYKETLREHFVLVDPDERREMITGQIGEIAAELGGRAAIDEELLTEVTYLVEYPTALYGRIDREFLRLPAKVVITPMREHQRYFPVFDDKGGLLPYFITVRNGGGRNIDAIARGNERVLRARLSDAVFFYNEDRKRPLADNRERLKTVVFQEGLGSLYDKSRRLSALSLTLADLAGLSLDAGQRTAVVRTADLAKADLVSGLVCEFTELQGVMGREYAGLDGEAPLVAEGIFEHYLPRFAGDALPETLTGRLVGLADKLDNIAATFSRGLIPTGSQDPYALRRQAIGVINTVRQAGYNLPLSAAFREALRLLGAPEELSARIVEFFRQRARNMLSEEELRYDLADAVLAVDDDDFAELFKRAAALKAFAAGGRLARAVRAFTRVANISRQAAVAGLVDPALFREQAEGELFNVCREVKNQAARALAERDYSRALALAASLAEPVDGFFDRVMVMAPDKAVRNNRLLLVLEVKRLASGVADFSRIVEEKGQES